MSTLRWIELICFGMNWSALPRNTSSAIQSQDQKRAALLEQVDPCSSYGYSAEQRWLADHRLMLQALIAGSGLLSGDPDDVARNTQEKKQQSNTSPAGMQRSSVLSNDYRQTSSAPRALPHRPERVSFQHTVRGQSSSKDLMQSGNSTATVSAALLTQPPGPTQSFMWKEKTLPSLPVLTPKESWSTGHIQATDSDVNTCGTPDEAMPQSLAWQALVALADSHDRSAGSRWKDALVHTLLRLLHVSHILGDAAAIDCTC